VCGHASAVTEGFSHISLPLPDAGAPTAQGFHSVAAVLAAHLRCALWGLPRLSDGPRQQPGLGRSAPLPACRRRGGIAPHPAALPLPPAPPHHRRRPAAAAPRARREEEVAKACDGCGAGSAAHRVELRFKRLPRCLLLHLKRFSGDGGSGKVGARSAGPRAPGCRRGAA
jgi:hypothetical protein